MNLNKRIDVSIITITYNEKENIAKLILNIEEIFKKNKINGEIVVVDDNSPDGTGKIIQRLSKRFNNIKLIKRLYKFGIGSAYYEGIKNSIGQILILMDADFSHYPYAIPAIIKKAKEGYIVGGSRFLDKNGFSTKWYRKIGTILLNLWIRILFKTGIKDHTNGYIGINKSNLNKILIKGTENGIFPFDRVLYGIPIFAIASIFRFKKCEVFAPYKFRKGGETKINFLNGLKIVLNDSLYALKLFFNLRK